MKMMEDFEFQGESTPIQNDRYLRQWNVPSTRKDGLTYKVSQRKDGIFECSCQDWIYRRQDCKHILKLKLEMRGDELSLAKQGSPITFEEESKKLMEETIPRIMHKRSISPKDLAQITDQLRTLKEKRKHHDDVVSMTDTQLDLLEQKLRSLAVGK